MRHHSWLCSHQKPSELCDSPAEFRRRPDRSAEGPSPPSPDNAAGIWPIRPASTLANRRTASPTLPECEAEGTSFPSACCVSTTSCREHIHPSWRAEWQVFGAQASARSDAAVRFLSVNRRPVNQEVMRSNSTWRAKLFRYELSPPFG